MSSVGNRGCRVNSYQLSAMQVVRRRTARHRQSSDLGAATMHRGGRFAQLVIRRFLGLVYRVVALSPVVAAPEGIARASSAGWGSSGGLRAAWVRLLRMGRHQFSGEPNDQVSRR